MNTLAVVLTVSIGTGLLASLMVRRAPRADSSLASAEKVGGELRRTWMRDLLRSRMDPKLATGLGLTIVLLGLVVTGAVVGISIWLIRSESALVRFDRGVERWADEHSTGLTDTVLAASTHLGDTVTVVVVGVVVAAYGLWRWRRWSIPLFLALVIAGQAIITNTIKFAVDRARPELRPRASLSGASFPSGHTVAAIGTYLAVAIVLGIAASPRTRALLAGVAVAIGVAVASTRVALGVHWLSDVVAGAAIAWTWLGLCAVAFGGRFMRFGVPAAIAAQPPVAAASRAASAHEHPLDRSIGPVSRADRANG